MIKKVAIASSNGTDTDLHVGHAHTLSIYNYNGEFIEERHVEIEEDAKHQWTKVLKVIDDCEAIIAVQSGLKSKAGFTQAGKKIVIDKGTVKEVLERYLKHIEFMEN